MPSGASSQNSTKNPVTPLIVNEGTQIDSSGRTKVSGLLYDSVFGPVDSRRYGRSLGINPFPPGQKVCTFDCPYCECGPTEEGGHETRRPGWPAVASILEEVLHRLESESESGSQLGAMTLAGNGEPTLYPHFYSLMKGLVSLRRVRTPNTKIIVLTNGSLLGSGSVDRALQLADEACFKLDAGNAVLQTETNRPWPDFSYEDYLEKLRQFKGAIIQTLFLQGRIDNTLDSALVEWIERLKKIQPARVDIYSLDRKSPDETLEKVSPEVLQEIAGRVTREVEVPVCVY